MKNIAITGSFAVGKTFILSFLKSAGFKVFSCDEYLNNLYLDPVFQQKIVTIIPEMGVFNKKYIIKQIYTDNKIRNSLESFIHPIVKKAIKNFEQKYLEENLIFTEVPLLFESNFESNFFKIICVYCSEIIRLKRAQSKKYFNKDVFNKIKDIQLSQEVKKYKSDFLINSDQDLNQIKVNINQIIKEIK